MRQHNCNSIHQQTMGNKSPLLCYQTWELWNLAIDQNIKLKAAHIAGKSNISADQFSRVNIRQTEWMLKKEIVQRMFQLWGHPFIDMFASIYNRITQIFCTWFPLYQAYALHALTIPWEGMCLSSDLSNTQCPSTYPKIQNISLNISLKFKIISFYMYISRV